jgi:hypothetical protein
MRLARSFRDAAAYYLQRRLPRRPFGATFGAMTGLNNSRMGFASSQHPLGLIHQRAPLLPVILRADDTPA